MDYASLHTLAAKFSSMIMFFTIAWVHVCTTLGRPMSFSTLHSFAEISHHFGKLVNLLLQQTVQHTRKRITYICSI